ncbi:DUF2164 domain-containing protein [Myxococcota bacterium]|nr:DUF2164 domain-containing protein [Myxococcota bacterium]MBU1379324.1 DUF2164 domain-containing protein [Myxococcota bacterium]MBU1497001.1 DUF2164 domain-containing protein [Myxococcota bacterium]
MNFKFEKETEKQILNSIKQFFNRELEEDIGDLKAMLILDYFNKELAPSVYNKAIADARVYIEEKISDMDNFLYTDEFTYWKKK